MRTVEEAVRCVWKKADTGGEGASFSEKRTRSLQAAPWTQFCPRFLRLENLGHILKDTDVLLPCLCVARTQTVQANVATDCFYLENCVYLFCGFRVAASHAVADSMPPARCVFSFHVSWLPKKSRNHLVPNKFQCYHP